MTQVVYLHGFLSAPQSAKAQTTQAYFRQHLPHVDLHVPALPNAPSQLRAAIAHLCDSNPQWQTDGVSVIGSSMGGYLATYLTERFGGRAVLINPAVQPYKLLNDYLGDHQNPYTGEQFTISANDVAILREFKCDVLAADNHYRVLLQTGDETLDYREAEQRYQGFDVRITQGGDHSYINYADELPEIARFLGLTD